MTGAIETTEDAMTAFRERIEALEATIRAKDKYIDALVSQNECYWNAMTYVHETVPMPRRERLDKLLGKTP